MLGRVWRFIKRHRGKLALGGALAAGGAYLLHWWWLQQPRQRWRGGGGSEDEVTALLSELERAQFLRSTGQNCAATVAALLPGLAAQLDKDLSVQQVKAELRAKPGPERRAELCDQLRARAFARLLASVYAVCGAVLCAHVQLHLLAGLLCRQKRAAAASSAAGAAAVSADDSDADVDGAAAAAAADANSLPLSDEVKMAFLGLLDARSHASQLAARLEAHCLAECAAWDVREPVPLRRLDSLLHRLRLGFEASLQQQHQQQHQLLLPSLRAGFTQRQQQRESSGEEPEEAPQMQQQQQLLRRLCAEADARLMSPEAGRVLKRLLDTAGLALLRVFTAHYQGLNTEASLHERTLPLLKVLPLLNSTAGLLLSRQFLDASGLTDNAELLGFSASLFDSMGGHQDAGREMS